MGIRTLARTADIDRSHLSRVERGLVGASAAKLHRIADALQVPPDAITHKEKP